MMRKTLITVILLSCFHGYESNHAEDFDVQAVTDIAEYSPGYFCLTCQFADNATGRGCHVVLTSRVDGFTTSKNGLKTTNADHSAPVCFTLNRGGYYDLRVYDIEQDGSVRIAEPAISTLVTVQGPITMSSEGQATESPNSNAGVIGGGIGGSIMMVIACTLIIIALVIQQNPKSCRCSCSRKGKYKKNHEHKPEKVKLKSESETPQSETSNEAPRKNARHEHQCAGDKSEEVTYAPGTPQSKTSNEAPRKNARHEHQLKWAGDESEEVTYAPGTPQSKTSNKAPRKNARHEHQWAGDESEEAFALWTPQSETSNKAPRKNARHEHQLKWAGDKSEEVTYAPGTPQSKTPQKYDWHKKNSKK